MKRLILLFLCILATSVSYEPYHLIANQIIEKLQLGFDASEFFLAFNRELGLVSTSSMKNCADNVIPTLSGSESVLLNILTLHWNGAFEDIPALRNDLNDFQDDCYKPWNAYSDYFSAAVSAFESDPESFFETVFGNLERGKYDAILATTDLIVFLLQDLDDKAGQALANLVQIALSSYLPQPVIEPLIFD